MAAESFDILHGTLVLDAQIEALADRVFYYKSYFDEMVANLNLAARNIVSPTLLSYAELDKVVTLAIAEFKLTPAVTLDNLQDYYQLISGTWAHCPDCTLH